MKVDLRSQLEKSLQLIVIFSSFLMAGAAAGNEDDQWDSSGTNTFVEYQYDQKGRLDNTIGCGAFSDIGLMPNTRNIDIGGGRYDYVTIHLKEKYGIENHVYDPFSRSREHNQKVLSICEQRPFDTATSMSVLNVIDRKEVRIAHIQLTYDCLQPGGIAYFKVYRGDGSGTERYGDKKYQSNRGAESYLDEVEMIYGKINVTLSQELNLIIAKKAQVGEAI